MNRMVHCGGDVGHSWVPLRDLSEPPGRGHLLLWCRWCGAPIDWTNTRKVFAHEKAARARGLDAYPAHHPIADEQRGGGADLAPASLNGRVKEGVHV